MTLTFMNCPCGGLIFTKLLLDHLSDVIGRSDGKVRSSSLLDTYPLALPLIAMLIPEVASFAVRWY